MENIRVLHCPTMVGGNPQGLVRAERELGLKSWSVAFRQNSFGYEADEVLVPGENNQFKLEIKRWNLLLRALKSFDVLHFNFGLSIMPQRPARNSTVFGGRYWLKSQLYKYYAAIFELRDLSLLKKSGKRIVVTYQGDDARQGDFCLSNFEISPANNEVEGGYYSREWDAQKKRRIAKFSKYADRIYALNPDLLHVLPSWSQFLPYSHIDLRDWRMVDAATPYSEVPVIVHAPSHRGVKGTDVILDAICRLEAEGVALKFIMVEDLPHREARKVYERADLVIDQLLCGWYGGLGVEFMALGKPVICYIREKDLKFIPEQMREDLPIINATPATVYDVVKEWITVRKDELRTIGRRSRDYVEKWHDPLKIAARLKGEYESIVVAKPQKSLR